jgi:hypothetical protein
VAKDKRKQEDPTRSLLGVQERNFMLINMMRRQDAFDRARQHLRTDHFTPEEKWISTIWSCVGEHVDEFGELPGKEALIAKFNARFEEDPDEYSDDDLQEAEDFIATMYAMDESSFNDKVAFGWLRKFLEDRLVDQIRSALTTSTTPQDMRSKLTAWNDQAADYQALEGKRVSKAFPENWDKSDTAFISKRTTGISFFDSYMGGGDAAGESYGMLGPYAGGKTTAAVMLTTARALLAYNAWLRAGKQGSYGLSFHFTYEEPLGALRLRALSYMAKIPRGTLEQAVETQNYGLLSRTGNLKPYEQRRFRTALQSGQAVQGEFQRFRWAQRVLNQCWRVIDMTGSDEEFPGRGSGLVDEVAAIVRQEVSLAARDGEPVHVDLVLVDYVLACIERHTDDREALRHLIRNFPMQMKHKVAIPFSCPVWSMHQLDTTAQALAPGRMPNKTNASEGRAFAERLDFLFAIGNATREGNAAFGPLKVRRVKMEGPIVVQLDGDNAQLLDKREEYTINERTHRIISMGEARVVGGGAVPLGQQQPGAVDDEDAGQAVDPAQVAAMQRQQNSVRPTRPRTRQ